MTIEQKLSLAKEFQNKYPDAHLGGSLGLWLHGIDLKRDLSKCDLDIVVPDPLNLPLNMEDFEDSSEMQDFDYAFRYQPAGSQYIKVDIRVSKDAFITINRDGIDYNVSLAEDIIKWKQKYAEKGVKKHIDDLIVINGGERPVIQEQLVDDLPF